MTMILIFLVVFVLVQCWSQHGHLMAHSQQAGSSLPKERLNNLTEKLWNYLSLCSIPTGLRNMDVLSSHQDIGRLVIEAVCHPGFTLDGSSVISCNHGQWNGSMPRCVPADCLSHYYMGRRRSGQYTIQPQPGQTRKAFCQMASFPPQDCQTYYSLGQRQNGFYNIRQVDGSVRETFCFMASFSDNAARPDCLAFLKAGHLNDGVYGVYQQGKPQMELFCAMSTAYSVASNCKAFYDMGHVVDGMYFYCAGGQEVTQMYCAMSSFSSPSPNCMAYHKKGYTKNGYYFMKPNLSAQFTSEQYCAMSTFSSPKEDCLAHYTSGHRVNGVYFVQSKTLAAMEVSCDMQSNGGGWTLIQHRQDNSVNFRRTYNSYKAGFGNTGTNFWIGLEALHQLTKKDSEVYFYLEAKDDDSAWAQYSHFQVAQESEGYRLTITGYNGTAGDAMEIHNGQKFSTSDKDQDGHVRRNCAAIARGGWWYDNCYYANLNGPYVYPKMGVPTISWVQYKGFGKSLRKTIMMTRRRH